MPRIVDHESRRTEIVEAAWTVIQRLGIESLRLADVAREAGFTTGVLPTYFQDRQQLLDTAYLMAADRLFERIEAVNADVRPGIGRLFNAMAEMLPRPGVPESTAFVAMCFAARGSSDGAVTRAYRHKSDKYLRMLNSYIQQAIVARAVTVSSVPVETLSQVLVTVVDGLCIRALLLPKTYTHDYCRATLESAIMLVMGVPADVVSNQDELRPVIASPAVGGRSSTRRISEASSRTSKRQAR